LKCEGKKEIDNEAVQQGFNYLVHFRLLWPDKERLNNAGTQKPWKQHKQDLQSLK
jgi:hypothetical protein